MQHNEASHATSKQRLRIIAALSIVAAVMLLEIIGGTLTGSLSLVSDGGHMLVDALALTMALLALNIARRPPTLTRTYGYHRVEILAALANGITLVLIAAYIFFEAYRRFSSPPAVETTPMLIIAVTGLVANFAEILLLSDARHGSLNIRAMFWHILSDTVSSLGVISGSIAIRLTGLRIIDPIIAIFIGLFILWGAVRLVRDSADILLEAVPRHIQIDKVVAAIKAIPGVQDIHDIHVWTITSGIYTMSAHLMIDDQMVSNTGEIVERVNRDMAREFGISHSTLQLECNRCGSCPLGMVCNLGHPESGGS